MPLLSIPENRKQPPRKNQNKQHRPPPVKVRDKGAGVVEARARAEEWVKEKDRDVVSAVAKQIIRRQAACR